MPSHKCSYFRCANTSKQKSMFRFPWNDANRLKVWLRNCGNLSIAHLSPESLRSRYLCIDHFNMKYVRNETGHRKRLRRTAVPENYQSPQIPDHSAVHALLSSPAPSSPDILKVRTPRKVYGKKRNLHTHDIEEMLQDQPDDVAHLWSTPKRKRKINEQDTPKCKELKKRLVDSSNKLKREQNKNKSLKNKICGRNMVDLSKHKFNSESSKLLTTMQLRKSKSKKQWTDAEKKFCMSLYYKSPVAYKFMMNSGIVLAAPSTIQRWLQETNCLPGIKNEIFESIKNKFADKSIKERACAVCFDEMSIMADLEYTNKYDLIEGFEDFGGGDRINKEARYALVFVARGIYSNWKIPVAYFLSSKSVDSNKLGKIVNSVINKLFESGLLPKVTVCDQAATNVKMIKDLGASVDYPFFFINGHKIFAIFDAPHLIKSIRNNLINNDFELDGNQISFKDVIKVYEIDKNNKSKSLKKLTPVHMNPNSFQKMKVKLATQVLSNSVSGAIKTAIDSGELKSSSANNTADFVKICNDLFDCLNSKNKVDPNPYRCAITNNQNTAVNQTLIKGKEIFMKLKKISLNKNKKKKGEKKSKKDKKISFNENEKQLTRPPCFDGMIQTINAIQQLSAEEFTAGTGVKFIITYRLNQDVIENLFGIYRIKGGCNKNPTSKLLRSMFRSNLLNNLMKFDKTNCESDQDMFVTIQQDTQGSDPQPSTSSSVRHQVATDDEIGGPSLDSNEPATSSFSVTATLEGSSDSTEVEVTLEMCSVVYFAGWLGKSCVDKLNCADCKKILLKNEVDLTDKKQLLLINKTYSNIVTPTLKSPSDYLFQLVNKVLDFFNENIDGLHKINLVSDLVQNLKYKMNAPDNYHDLDHFDYLIKKLLEVKIHDYCKSRKKSLKSASKLRILQNK